MSNAFFITLISRFKLAQISAIAAHPTASKLNLQQLKKAQMAFAGL